MNAPDFTEDLIFTAYKKLKHYFYYDNTTLVTRKRIAKFEEKYLFGLDKKAIKPKLKELVDLMLLQIHQGNIDIAAYILPKKIKKPVVDIITNYKNDSRIFEVERLNILSDASIEIHIICTLWMLEVGRFLENTVSPNNFAYKMSLDIDEDRDTPWENLKLYQPYFVQYQEWRDKSIAKAESLLKEKRNVTILSLDIKDYFHCVRLDFGKLARDVEDEVKIYYEFSAWDVEHVEEKQSVCRYLNETLRKIHESYYSHLKRFYDTPIVRDGNYPLPIGLISSGLLGNYYLNDFDDSVIDKLNPAYYGRYVDDLMFVFSDLKISSNGYTSTINTFLNKYFVKRGLLAFTEVNKSPRFFGTKGKYIDNLKDLPKEPEPVGIDQDTLDRMTAKELKFNLAKYKILQIQSSKVILHYFDYRESKAALNIFKLKLEEQRSEFRFLPDEDEVSKEFDQEAFSLQYNDSINKFRSIQDFTEDKYGASKFLAKKIFARNFGEFENDEETDQQILTFFKEYVGINFYSLWEKVATYFVVCGRGDNLIRFKRNIELAINRVNFVFPGKIEENQEISTEIKKYLQEFLKISIAIPLALNPNIKLERSNKNEAGYFEEIKVNYASCIRRSNLFRQSLVNLPLLNYTAYLRTEGSLLIYNPNFLTKMDSKIDFKLGYLAPNYVGFHEVNIFKIAMVINTLTEDKLEKSAERLLRKSKQTQNGKDIKLDVINGIPDSAFNVYYKINYGWKKIRKDKTDLKSIYFKLAMNNRGVSDIGNHVNIDVMGERDAEFNLEKPNKKVAIANMKVETKNVDLSILQTPNVSKNRRKEVFRLLNLADKYEADLIVFPEVSIPYAWLRLLAERSHKRYMGIVAGLEHWINSQDFAFNFMVTILPFKVHHYKTSLIKIRLKNHYSPSEKELLKGHRLLIPRDTVRTYPKLYDLFHWRKTYFSVYNCFELADIADRSIFKSKVDFIVASEYNSDTNYFSDVAGAWVRDVHCYFIQVNSSDYGDSRLIQPSKSYSKDLIQVKGGINSTVLVGELDIDKLRDFQYVEYNLQKDKIDKGRVDIKPTPPDFDTKEVKKRIDNKNLI